MVPERTQARANPARGVALICTALVVGIFLLRNGFDSQGVPDVAADTTAVTQPGGEGTTPPEGGTTAPPAETPLKEPKDITVRVLNAAAVNGAAANWTETINQAGYKTIDATNAQPVRDTTAVLYQPGYDREAVELARAIGAPEDGTVALNEPPQVDSGGANLVVLLGTDIANG